MSSQSLFAPRDGQTPSGTSVTQPPTSRSGAPASPLVRPTPIEPITLVTGLYYSSAQQLDVYAPREPGLWPIVVILHGLGDSRSDWSPLAKAIAPRGVVVFNVGFRAEEVQRPGGVEDAACAVRFARATGSGYGGDPARITVLGISAGAVHGALVALAGDRFGGDCAEGGVSALPAALVGVAGPYDPTLCPGDPRPALRQTDPARYDAMNPFTHLGGNPSLRVSLLHGADDADVPPGGSIGFHAALTAAGYAATLTLLEGYGHEIPLPTSRAFDAIVRETLKVARAQR